MGEASEQDILIFLIFLHFFLQFTGACTGGRVSACKLREGSTFLSYAYVHMGGIHCVHRECIEEHINIHIYIYIGIDIVIDI